ncbi:hypothetical protein D3C81_1987560 [compost metagenome]
MVNCTQFLLIIWNGVTPTKPDTAIITPEIGEKLRPKLAEKCNGTNILNTEMPAPFATSALRGAKALNTVPVPMITEPQKISKLNRTTMTVA